jgi:hypothetical protein
MMVEATDPGSLACTSATALSRSSKIAGAPPGGCDPRGTRSVPIWSPTVIEKTASLGALRIAVARTVIGGDVDA